MSTLIRLLIVVGSFGFLPQLALAQHAVTVLQPTGGQAVNAAGPISLDVEIKWPTGMATPITGFEMEATYITGANALPQIINLNANTVNQGGMSMYKAIGTFRLQNPPAVPGAFTNVKFYGTWIDGMGVKHRTGAGTVQIKVSP